MKSVMINRVLTAILLSLLLIILTATVTVICVRASAPSVHGDVATPYENAVMRNIDNVGAGEETYTSVGSVHSVTRASDDGTTADDGVGVVVTAWFSYHKDDSIFFEELSTKSVAIKKTIEGYFEQHTYNELVSAGEEQVKSELRDTINECLTLGEIGTLYFSEYIFLK